MTKNRKRAQQKPPPGIVWIEDYIDPETGDITPGIASRLGITPSTYKKWRMRGEGPDAFLLGKLVAARIAVIDAYIADLEKQSDAAQIDGDSRPPEPRRPVSKRLAPAA